MKFIQYNCGRGKEIYHIACTAEEFGESRKNLFGHFPNSTRTIINLCDGNYPQIGDLISEHPPSGRLCKRCRERYLMNHTEEDLILELI